MGTSKRMKSDRDGRADQRGDRLFGIVIANGAERFENSGPAPRISAFIWGGKIRPTPTLPFGRWRGAA